VNLKEVKMSDSYYPKETAKTFTIKVRELKLLALFLVFLTTSYIVACSAGPPEVKIAWCFIVMMLTLMGCVGTAICYIVSLHEGGN
jgi:hypothetical protein